MEIEGSDGSKTRLKPYSTIVFGRENGFHPNDLAVSRRHISFEFNPTQPDPLWVSFEVLGKNPLWVFFPKNKDAKIMVFKRFQRGQLGIGDIFCLSPKYPVWFTVKEVEDENQTKGGEIEGTVNDELTQSLDISYGFTDNGEFGLDSVDVTSIDPLQEFGFLVIGHEFDEYPKQMIRDVKNWNWFLEDPRRDSDDEEENRGRSGGGHRGKRKKTEGDSDVDDEWTGGGDGDEEIGTTKARKVQRPTYQTRSKERGKPNKDGKDQGAYGKSSSKDGDEEEEEDETLGGFIVEDETVKEEEDEEEDEEEFVEDEDEDEEELED